VSLREMLLVVLAIGCGLGGYLLGARQDGTATIVSVLEEQAGQFGTVGTLVRRWRVPDRRAWKVVGTRDRAWDIYITPQGVSLGRLPYGWRPERSEK